MKILRSVTIATALLGVGGIGYAATPEKGPPPRYADPVIADADAMRAADQIKQTPLSQLLKEQLAKAGLTDIDVRSASFIVHAKTKAGKPVALVIGPDGVSEIVKVTSPVIAEQPH